MRLIAQHILDKIRAHSCHWASLPLTSVPSAAVTDEQTEAWSSEAYERDLDEDRKSSARRTLTLIGFGGLITAAAIAGTAVAKADPVTDYVVINAPIVCALLSQTSTEAGVEGVILALHEKGLTFEQAGEVVARSVVGWCPSEMPEARAFVAKWTTAGRVGA
jgi:hypothetical protein